MNLFLGLVAQGEADSERVLRHRRGFAETWTGENRGRLCIFILWIFCAAVVANCQTVGEAAKLQEYQQRAIISGFVDNALKNLASHTDRSGKTKSAEQYEQDRALAREAHDAAFGREIEQLTQVEVV